MFCKYCGEKIADDSVFCKYCGKNVLDNDCEESSNPLSTPVVENGTKEQNVNKKAKTRVDIVSIFLLSLAISVACCTGFAIIRMDDSKPFDKAHSMGDSVYDPPYIMGSDYQNDLTNIRKEKFEEGLMKTALYSFPISFVILLISAKIRESSKDL